MKDLRSSSEIIIVGNKFHNFTNIQGAMTVSEFSGLVEEEFNGTVAPNKIIFGQGVSESWVVHIKSKLDLLDIKIEVAGDKSILTRTSGKLSHKVKRHNILISDPLISGSQKYVMNLCIDDECELMADHTTGSHIQGMILIEAARQAFLAVSESYMMPSKNKYYFVINKFAFPVPTKIGFEIYNFKSSGEEKLSVCADINFIQNDSVVCSVDVSYTALLDSRLSTKEREMSAKSLEYTLGLASESEDLFSKVV
ncbi:MAG: hypothetical protein ACI8SR_002158 [Oceanicoccus sp.]|jgi:hypothetical protein